jgi:hypothetical protein
MDLDHVHQSEITVIIHRHIRRVHHMNHYRKKKPRFRRVAAQDPHRPGLIGFRTRVHSDLVTVPLDLWVSVLRAAAWGRLQESVPNDGPHDPCDPAIETFSQSSRT